MEVRITAEATEQQFETLPRVIQVRIANLDNLIVEKMGHRDRFCEE